MTAVIPRAISFVHIAGPSESGQLSEITNNSEDQIIPGQTLRAFSIEADTGSCEKNASKQRIEHIRNSIKRTRYRWSLALA